MYLYTSVPLFAETKGGYGCCTYRRGLSALFVPDSWHCEGLEHGTDEGEIPTPLLYILAGITIIRSSNGNPGDAHLQNDMIHAGQLIERTLHEQGRTVTWFRYPTMLHTPQCLQDIPKREYRHPPALAHLLHPQPRLLPRFIRQHQYGQLLRCIQIGYNSVSSLELCFRLLV